ncbi:DUF4031 domain-containing protein [Anaerolineales bacterium HSG6]|nr:DUF4031 domain-containing protein [Anaerolineales bacterium HSG6]
MIYVDTFQDYSFGKQVHPVFQNGSAHLATDSDDLSDLHAFAAKLGLRRAWFQDKRIPHYDLNRDGWLLAQKHGAQLVSARELIRRCRPKQKKLNEKRVTKNEERPLTHKL